MCALSLSAQRRKCARVCGLGSAWTKVSSWGKPEKRRCRGRQSGRQAGGEAQCMRAAWCRGKGRWPWLVCEAGWLAGWPAASSHLHSCADGLQAAQRRVQAAAAAWPAIPAGLARCQLCTQLFIGQHAWRGRQLPLRLLAGGAAGRCQAQLAGGQQQGRGAVRARQRRGADQGGRRADGQRAVVRRVRGQPASGAAQRRLARGRGPRRLA